MGTIAKRRAAAFVRQERGAFALEASMVVPWLLLITFALLLYLIGMADRVLADYTAAVAAERAAFAWTHEAGDGKTGAYPEGGTDGLYWRLGEDGLLAGLFGWASRDEDLQVRFPAEEAAEPEDSAPLRKLRRAAGLMPEGESGDIAFRNEGWRRVVTVRMGGGIWPAALLRLTGASGGGSTGGIRAVVTEPAEFIRTIDLIRYYQARWGRGGSGDADSRRQASDVLRRLR